MLADEGWHGKAWRATNQTARASQPDPICSCDRPSLPSHNGMLSCFFQGFDCSLARHQQDSMLFPCGSCVRPAGLAQPSTGVLPQTVDTRLEGNFALNLHSCRQLRAAYRAEPDDSKFHDFGVLIARRRPHHVVDRIVGPRDPIDVCSGKGSY